MTNNTLQKKIIELKELKELKEELQKEIEVRENEIKDLMITLGTQEMKVGNFTVRYTAMTKNTFDSSTFKKMYAELYKQFLKPTNSRRFSII